LTGSLFSMENVDFAIAFRESQVFSKLILTVESFERCALYAINIVMVATLMFSRLKTKYHSEEEITIIL
jgi:hypothetical protein